MNTRQNLPVLFLGLAVLLAGPDCSTTATGDPTGSGGTRAGGAPGEGGRAATGGALAEGGSTMDRGGGGGGSGGTPHADAAAAGGVTTTGGATQGAGGAAMPDASSAQGGSANPDATTTGGVTATGGGPGGTGGAARPDAEIPDTRIPPDLSVDTPSEVSHPRRLILCDEGNQRIAFLDLDKPTSGWKRPITGLRDIQLVGNNRLGVSIPEGYVELDLDTGAIVKEVKAFANVQSFRRLPNGNTILGMEASGTTLQELDPSDTPIPGRKVSFPALTSFRLFRRTPQDTFLVGAGNTLAEVNWNKETVWEMTFPGTNLYVYQGLRLPDGHLAVTQGYGASLMIVDTAAKKILTTIGGQQQPEAAAIQPNFYAGFQILPNGNFVVTNWEGHGTGNGGKGIQLLEYDPSGKLVWKWQQDPSLVSSLHHVLVLDGLDPNKLHDDLNGALEPPAPS